MSVSSLAVELMIEGTCNNPITSKSSPCPGILAKPSRACINYEISQQKTDRLDHTILTKATPEILTFVK